MKRLRWITFLPLALLGGLVVNFVLSIGASAPFVAAHQVLSWIALGGSGVAFSGALFTIGFKLAPTVNRASKWLLAGTALVVGLLGVAVAVLSKDPEAMATSIGALASTLPILLSSPEQLSKWFRVEPYPVGS